MNKFLLRFWAKTSDAADDPARQHAFHPLICHMIDVACVAEAMWRDVLPETTKKRLAEPFGLAGDPKSAGKLIAFLIGLHDLGKCSPPFALRGKNVVESKECLLRKLNNSSRDPAVRHRSRPRYQTIELLKLYTDTDYDCVGFKKAESAPHGFVTSIILPEILAERFCFPKKLAVNLANVIGGHHGTFPDTNFLNRNTGAEYCGNEVWRRAQFELFNEMAVLFGVKGDFSGLRDDNLDNAAAMVLAGLTSVADWIGSNVRHRSDPLFVCEVDDYMHLLDGSYSRSLDDYKKEASATAENALEILGWSRWPKGEKRPLNEFDQLFPNLKDKHRNLQAVAIDIANELNTAGICLIEAPMGEGKTEAAMYLADASNANLGTRGIYFALPTQATSDQMFGRIEEFLSRRFKDERVNGEPVDVHLMLAHGHASLSEEFNDKIKTFDKVQSISDDAESNEKLRESSNVVAAEWFTAKKRSTLVPFGVGTIDQILLAVLQVKYVFVRHFGLANKTIIIDEVHAYDAYMSTLLERLLEWLAALGSPVIILSATLPKQKRDLLIKAYLKGVGQTFEDREKPAGDGEKDEYPRISYATAEMPEKTFRVRHLETSDQNTKTLHLEWKDESTFIDDLKAALADGGCAAIICNTVQKAQDIYDLLSRDSFFEVLASDGGPKLDLLHARFRYKDRKDREDRSLKRFGKPDLSEPGAVATGFRKHDEKTSDAEDEPKVVRPDCAVLVSTQIIEQSLDLDFDLLISELAPADLLLQRAGRLQRHDRDSEKVKEADKRPKTFRNVPTLWLLKPEIDSKGAPDFGKSAFVYDKHILLRSWVKLRDRKSIEIPGEIEELIEDVYDKKRECVDEKYRALWDATKTDLDKKLAEKRLKAKAVYLTDFDDDDFYNSFKFQLDEDDPEKHSTLRAQTRDEERPTVAIVLLTQEEAQTINLNDKPDRKTTEFLIKREVKISRSGLTQPILANPEFKKAAWEKSPLLRHHRLIVLDENKQISIGKTTMVLDNERGVEFKTEGAKSE